MAGCQLFSLTGSKSSFLLLARWWPVGGGVQLWKILWAASDLFCSVPWCISRSATFCTGSIPGGEGGACCLPHHTEEACEVITKMVLDDVASTLPLSLIGWVNIPYIMDCGQDNFKLWATYGLQAIGCCAPIGPGQLALSLWTTFVYASGLHVKAECTGNTPFPQSF